jgi:hypothetical protein
MRSVDDVREIKFDLEPEIKTAIEEEQRHFVAECGATDHVVLRFKCESLLRSDAIRWLRTNDSILFRYSRSSILHHSCRSFVRSFVAFSLSLSIVVAFASEFGGALAKRAGLSPDAFCQMMYQVRRLECRVDSVFGLLKSV